MPALELRRTLTLEPELELRNLDLENLRTPERRNPGTDTLRFPQ
jgi:hypothetical protein